MDLYVVLKNKYARETAETDMKECGINVMLLRNDRNVRNNNILIKEKTNAR